MEYSIHELSKMSSVSTRTLRYYDEIGLLKPSRVNDVGYRFYESKETAILQQILFYRERGLSLERIGSILYDDTFNPLDAMYEHLRELEKQQQKLSGLIHTVYQTIASMKGEKEMSDQEKFKVFKQGLVAEHDKLYGEESREKYGSDTVNASQRKLLNLSQEDFDKFQALQSETLESLKEAVINKENPEGEAGKKITQLHKKWLCYTWQEYKVEAHKGLVSMYLEDERFLFYYDKEQKGCAQFLLDAVLYWADKIK